MIVRASSSICHKTIFRLACVEVSQRLGDGRFLPEHVARQCAGGPEVRVILVDTMAGYPGCLHSIVLVVDEGERPLRTEVHDFVGERCHQSLALPGRGRDDNGRHLLSSTIKRLPNPL